MCCEDTQFYYLYCLVLLIRVIENISHLIVFFFTEVAYFACNIFNFKMIENVFDL